MPDVSFDGAPDAHRQFAPAADAHGRAALLLVESLIHGLIDRRILPLGDAIEIIDIAAEVERELALAGPVAHDETVSLLAPIAASLRFDLHE